MMDSINYIPGANWWLPYFQFWLDIDNFQKDYASLYEQHLNYMTEPSINGRHIQMAPV